MQAAPQRGVVRRREKGSEVAATSSATSGANRSPSMTVSPPVQFLVREQAKSHIAIRELQDRIRTLEESQGSLVEVVGELQLDLSRSLLCQDNTLASSSDLGKSFLRPRFTSSGSEMDRSTSGKKNYPKGSEESADNKQDSGVDSDCQAQLSVSNVSQPKNPTESTSPYEREDELLTLLDLINQRGTKLRQTVDDYEDRLQRPEQLEALSYQDVASLVHKCRSLQKKLKDVCSERDYLGSQLELYDNMVVSLKEENRRLEERLDGTVLEKRQLESKIHKLHGQFIRGNGQEWTAAKELEKAKRLKRRSLDENKTKISDILKEKSVLDLQRQMLHMVLENESLAQSLVQSEQQRLDSATEWEKRELQYRLEVQNLSKEKAELMEKFSQIKIENTDVSAKVKLLERALQAVSQDTKSSTKQMECTNPTIQKRRGSAFNFPQQLKPKSSNGVFQSLPPRIAVIPKPQNHLVYVENEIHPLRNTSGYLNISFEEPELEALENPQLNFRNCLPLNRSSTPIRAKETKDMFLSRLDIKSCSTRLNRSDSEHADLSSVCSEFDPLIQDVEGKNRIHFVDSLDALPANNVMFVPVNVANVPVNSEVSRYSSPVSQRVSYPNLVQRSGRMHYPAASYRRTAATVDAGLL